VQQYLERTSDAASDQQIQERLGPLIRCQHLSQFWLLLSVVSDDAGQMPLAQLQPQLKRLLTLRSATVTVAATAAELKDELGEIPPSWLLGERSITPVRTVELTWDLEVSKVREAAQRSAAQQQRGILTSPGVTPPLGGLAFELMVNCEPVESSTAVDLGFFVKPWGAPSDASYSFSFKLTAPDLDWHNNTSGICQHDGNSVSWGFGDFFALGPLAGGWDEVAWAARGLPASGSLVLKLSMLKVGHVAGALLAAH
jgi:hypothetical protein